jgi:hypothetical protein
VKQDPVQRDYTHAAEEQERAHGDKAAVQSLVLGSGVDDCTDSVFARQGNDDTSESALLNGSGQILE